VARDDQLFVTHTLSGGRGQVIAVRDEEVVHVMRNADVVDSSDEILKLSQDHVSVRRPCAPPAWGRRPAASGSRTNAGCPSSATPRTDAGCPCPNAGTRSRSPR